MEACTPGKMVVPGLVFYWFGAELFYANASHFATEAHKLVDEAREQVRWLVVDTGAITAIDFSAGRTLMDLQQDLAKQNVVLALTRVSPDLRQDLDALELTGVIGADRIFESRKASLEAYHAQSGTGAAA